MADVRKQPLRLAVLISGAGSTLENLVCRCRDGRLRGAAIVQVISSRAEAGGVGVARRAGLPVAIVPRSTYADVTAFSDALASRIDEVPADLVLMGGFLSLWRIPPHLAGRVLNIHPALLPEFGGRGMFGRRVHAAVLAAGCTESGCTVHLADDEYDHGPIVARRRVPVLPGDTPETLAKRVGAAERELYPWVLAQVVEHGVEWLARVAARGGTEL